MRGLVDGERIGGEGPAVVKDKLFGAGGHRTRQSDLRGGGGGGIDGGFDDDGQRRLGVLTDAGCSTPHIEKTLNGCDALVLECNHDREMLLRGQYPASLKQRVGGRLGHLSNDQAAEILSRIETGTMQHLVAAHLSAQNNQPSLAVAALSQVLGCHADWIDIATQTDGLDWREIV